MLGWIAGQQASKVEHFGLICPPAPSHVTALVAIGAELRSRGHRVTMFNSADAAPMVSVGNLDFQTLGLMGHPPGSLRRFTEKVGKLKGLAALRLGLRVAISETEMLLDEAPQAIQKAGVTALVVDQGQLCGSTIAERLGLPFFTFCNAVAGNRDPAVPPTMTAWSYSTAWPARLRNQLASSVFDLALSPLLKKINARRREWNLSPLRRFEETFSPLAQFSQQTLDFDFPNRSLPGHFHYIGSIARLPSEGMDFPFDKLNGKPVVYCSFGTLSTGLQWLHQCVVEAFEGLDVQLVMTGLAGSPPDSTGTRIVVSYAPQIDLLMRSILTVCHGGNNTVLDSLSCGVPIVAIPVANDQFAVSARLRRSGAGEFIPARKVNTERMRQIVRRVLDDTCYRERALSLRDSILNAGGARRVADTVETVLASHPAHFRAHA
jgi:zeaxanthin glucosyltransferase